MAGAVSNDKIVGITAGPAQSSIEFEEAQSLPHVAHGRIVLIPQPSHDPRDPLVCLVLFITVL
jgi:hypothetical protein